MLCIVSVSVFASAPLTLTLDPAAAGPVKFAADEVRREAAVRGLAVVGSGAVAPANAIGITLAVGAPAAQSAPHNYGIRVQQAQGRCTITVRGADATGVMYGGLDVAEAIRLGTPETLRDSDNTPLIAQRGITFNISAVSALRVASKTHHRPRTPRRIRAAGQAPRAQGLLPGERRYIGASRADQAVSHLTFFAQAAWPVWRGHG